MLTLGTSRVCSPPAGSSMAIAMFASPAHLNATCKRETQHSDEGHRQQPRGEFFKKTHQGPFQWVYRSFSTQMAPQLR